MRPCPPMRGAGPTWGGPRELRPLAPALLWSESRRLFYQNILEAPRSFPRVWDEGLAHIPGGDASRP